VKCRLCTNPITSSNRSPLKGVCKQDYKTLSVATAEKHKLDALKLPHNVKNHFDNPEPYTEQDLQTFLPDTSSRDIEIELTEQERKLLSQIRVKKAKRITRPTIRETFSSGQFSTPVQTAEKNIVVSLNQQEMFLLEQIRAARKFGTQFPLETRPKKPQTWEEFSQPGRSKGQYIHQVLNHRPNGRHV
jgi:hypothetical protein